MKKRIEQLEILLNSKTKELVLKDEDYNDFKNQSQLEVYYYYYYYYNYILIYTICNNISLNQYWNIEIIFSIMYNF